MRPQRGHQAHPAGQQRRAGPGQLRVPRVQGGRYRLAGRAAQVRLAPGRLEQRRALPQHPVVVGADARVPRRGGHQQLVEEPAPLAGVALDQGQVLRGEQHRAYRAQDVAGPRQRRAVEPDPVGAARVELDLDQRAAVDPGHGGAHHGAFGPLADQRRVGGHPVAAQGGQVADRLDQVGLALAVRPAERGHPRPQLQAEVGVRPEVGQREPGQVHSPSLRREPRGVSLAIERPARGRQAPPAARYYGEHRSRGAERSGGLRGVVPPG